MNLGGVFNQIFICPGVLYHKLDVFESKLVSVYAIGLFYTKIK